MINDFQPDTWFDGHEGSKSLRGGTQDASGTSGHLPCGMQREVSGKRLHHHNVEEMYGEVRVITVSRRNNSESHLASRVN